MPKATMRPRFTDQEVSFLLDLVTETKAKMDRQLLNLREEAEHLHRTIPELHRRFLYEDPYSVYKLIPEAEARLHIIEREWLPVYSKQRTILSYLAARLEKIQAHKGGRTTFCSDVRYYFNEIAKKNGSE